MSSETDLLRNQAIQDLRNSFSRRFPLSFNVETLQAFGALFQIPHYYRKFLYFKTKMLCTCLFSFTSLYFGTKNVDIFCWCRAHVALYLQM
jgi:hypothetical protein